MDLTKGIQLIDSSICRREDIKASIQVLHWKQEEIKSSELPKQIAANLSEFNFILYTGHGSTQRVFQYKETFKQIKKIQAVVALLCCHVMFYQDCGPFEGFSSCFNFLLKQCPLLCGSIGVIYDTQV